MQVKLAVLADYANVTGDGKLNILGVFVPGLLWEALSPGLTAILLLVQMATATAGAWIGHRVALRGGQELRG